MCQLRYRYNNFLAEVSMPHRLRNMVTALVLHRFGLLYTFWGPKLCDVHILPSTYFRDVYVYISTYVMHRAQMSWQENLREISLSSIFDLIEILLSPSVGEFMLFYIPSNEYIGILSLASGNFRYN